LGEVRATEGKKKDKKKTANNRAKRWRGKTVEKPVPHDDYRLEEGWGEGMAQPKGKRRKGIATGATPQFSTKKGDDRHHPARKKQTYTGSNCKSANGHGPKELTETKKKRGEKGRVWSIPVCGKAPDEEKKSVAKDDLTDRKRKPI